MNTLTLSNNSSMENSTNQPFTPNGGNQASSIASKVFIWLIIIVGLVGNSFIIAVVKIVQRMKTTTNYLLVNVAVADITTLLFTTIHFILNSLESQGLSLEGALVGFLCKFVYTNTITLVTLLVTVLTLTALAVERYHALVKPLRISRRLTTDTIAYVISGIWLVAIVMVLPLFISLNNQPNSSKCSPGGAIDQMRVYIICLIVIMTLIPFLFIAVCYLQIISGLYFRNTICSSSHVGCTKGDQKEKRRLIILLVLLTMVFFVAFVPYGVALILKFSKLNNKSPNELTAIVHYCAQYLTLMNCAVNPFIYASHSSNYKRGFKFIIKTILRRDTAAEALELRARASTLNL